MSTDIWFKTNTNTVSITPDSFYLQSYFRFKLKNVFVKIPSTGGSGGNNLSNGFPVKIHVMGIRNGSNVAWTFDLDDITNINDWNTTGQMEIIVNATINSVNNYVSFWLKNVNGGVDVYFDKKQLTDLGLDNDIFYDVELNGSQPGLTEKFEMTEDKHNLLFTYNFPPSSNLSAAGVSLTGFKLRLTNITDHRDSEIDLTGMGIPNKTTLLYSGTIVGDYIEFNTDEMINPPNLTKYDFALLGSNNIALNVEEFRGVINIYR
jgi:hypothetical protein